MAVAVTFVAVVVHRWRIQSRAEAAAEALRTAMEEIVCDVSVNDVGGVEFSWHWLVDDDGERGVSDDDLERIARTPGLSSVSIASEDITDLGVAHLARATGLRTVILTGARVTDSGVDSIATIEGLDYLDLAETAVSDAGIERLRSIKGLRGIVLSETSVGDAGLESLSAYNKELRGVEAENCDNITDSGVTALSRLPHLKRLVVSGQRITGGIAAPLSRCRTLEKVYLNVALTDAELVKLAEMPNLTVLRFAGTNCTESGLRALEGASQLETVIVSESSLIDHTVKEAVAKAYPDIDWRFVD